VSATLQLWYFGFFKVPLIFAARPTVIEISAQHVVIRIRMRRKMKNHFNAMYFPVLAIGADCAVGLLAVRAIRQTGLNISFIFKDFHAEFYRRATDDVEFRCNDSEAIKELVSKAASCNERVEQNFEIIATVPSESDEPVARLKLTLSLKHKS
jgi:acyl-coenzyme A thioesterase PaaI-like protein